LQVDYPRLSKRVVPDNAKDEQEHKRKKVHNKTNITMNSNNPNNNNNNHDSQNSDSNNPITKSQTTAGNENATNSNNNNTTSTFPLNVSNTGVNTVCNTILIFISGENSKIVKDSPK
jgi:hypothetical protein